MTIKFAELGGGGALPVQVDNTGVLSASALAASQVSDFSEAVDDRVNGLLVAGGGIGLTYDDGADTLTIAVSGLASTDISDFDEAVDDRVNGLLVAGSGIGLTYDDVANTMTIAVSGLASSDISDFDEAVDDRVAVLIQDGTGISWAYDDGANTLTPTISLAGFDTDDLSEGVTNLFFTDERVDDRVNGLLVAGANIDLTYDDVANTLTIAVSGLASTDISDFSEAVDDRVAALLVAGNNIDLTYDDGANTLTVAVESLTSADITDFSEAVDDRVDGLLVAGANIGLTYDDVGNTLTIAVTGLASTDISDFDEAVDDRVNGLLVAGTAITLTYDDGANTLTIATTGLVDGSGTAGAIPKWSDANTLTDSLITEDGSAITISGTLFVDDGTGSFDTNRKLHVYQSSGLTPVLFENDNGGSTANLLICRGGDNASTGSKMITFQRPDNTEIGTITQDSTTTVAYNTSSDERVKADIADSTLGLAEVLQIRPRRFRYRGDPANRVMTGFIAQELHQVFPDAVTPGDPDAKGHDCAMVDGKHDDNCVRVNPWGVDYSRLTPLLVRAIQELESRLKTLEG